QLSITRPQNPPLRRPPRTPRQPPRLTRPLTALPRPRRPLASHRPPKTSPQPHSGINNTGRRFERPRHASRPDVVIVADLCVGFIRIRARDLSHVLHETTLDGNRCREEQGY